MIKYRVRICRGPTCGDERNSDAVAEAFQRVLAEAQEAEVEVCWQSCYGRCRKGPNVLVRALVDRPPVRNFSVATPPPSSGGPATMYNYVTPADVVDIVHGHLATGRPVRGLIERAKRRDAEELAREEDELLHSTRDGDR